MTGIRLALHKNKDKKKGNWARRPVICVSEVCVSVTGHGRLTAGQSAAREHSHKKKRLLGRFTEKQKISRYGGPVHVSFSFLLSFLFHGPNLFCLYGNGP